MKTPFKNLLLALTVLVSLHASANDMPVAPIAPLARLVIGGGMPGPGFLERRIITIQDNGLVNLDEYYSSEDWNSGKPGKEVHVALTQMDANDFAAVNAKVAQLKGGEFKTSNDPQCFDAPGYYYSVFKNGQEIAIHKYEGCIHFPLKNRHQRALAAVVKKYLDDLNALDTLPRP